MKIKFPVACDRDYETVLAIIAPEIFNIEYACPEAREFYYSLTEADIKEIKEYVEQHKKWARNLGWLSPFRNAREEEEQETRTQRR